MTDADAIESVDDLCIELEAVCGRARAGNIPAWTVAGVLADYEDDIRAIGHIPPMWVDDD